MATVPDIVDSTQADAEAAILAASLVVGPVSESHDTSVDEGKVLSQNPIAGSTVDDGTAVSFTIRVNIPYYFKHLNFWR